MANNDFLPFAFNPDANVLTQAAYAALGSRSGGFSSGLAKSAEANKVWRQANTIASMIGQFIADMSLLDALDNADIPTLEARFKLALTNSTTRRTLILQDMTIYVNASTGNDNNDGLSAATAYRTVQRAITAVYYQYDWNNHNCVILLAHGTYTTNVVGGYAAVFYGNPFGMLQFGLTLRGDPNAQGAVVLNCVNSNGIAVQATKMYIDGLTIVATGTSWTLTLAQGIGIGVDMGGWANVSNCTFTCSSLCIWTYRASIIVMSGNNNTFTGTPQCIFAAEEAGIIYSPSVAYTVTGLALTPGPAISGVFAVAVQGAGVVWCPGCTFIGAASVTGTRYYAANAGSIQTGGGGPNYFPGSIAGNAVTGYYT